ncbi:unnamed protein product, partial [Arctogadus glacialis]
MPPPRPLPGCGGVRQPSDRESQSLKGLTIGSLCSRHSTQPGDSDGGVRVERGAMSGLQMMPVTAERG